MQRSAGSQFDPRVVAALAETLQRGSASLSPPRLADGAVAGGASSLRDPEPGAAAGTDV